MVSSGTRARDAYRQTELQSRTPLELVAMLYDGAIRFTSQARDAFVRRDIPARREAVSRVIAIVSHLQSTLDMERGGELAVTLDRLYTFILDRLMSASFTQDPALLDDVLNILNTLREGWVGIAAPGALAKAG